MALLVKPEPFSSEINRLVDTLFEPANANANRFQRWAPAMDLIEAEDKFVLKADLPGLGEDDVTIEVQDNVLTVSGERKVEHERKERGFYRVERSFGRFSRSLTLPEGVNAEGIKANFDKGVLEVSIPKPEERKPHRVTIGDAGDEPATLEGTANEK
jgi:HSP20 family protein